MKVWLTHRPIMKLEVYYLHINQYIPPTRDYYRAANHIQHRLRLHHQQPKHRLRVAN